MLAVAGGGVATFLLLREDRSSTPTSAAGVVAPVEPVAEAPVPATGEVFRSAEHGLVITFPEGWSIEEYDRDAFVHAFPQATDQATFISVFVQEVEPSFDLEALAAAARDFAESDGAEIIRDEPSTLGGEDAWLLEYATSTRTDFALATVVNEQLYGLGFTASPDTIDEHRDAVMSSFASFRFEEIDDAAAEPAVDEPAAAQPAPAPAVPVPGGTYVVQPGDTLATIAEAAYGDGSQFGLIADANRLTAANPLQIGQTLDIPLPTG